MIGVSPDTPRNWEKKKKLVYFLTKKNNFYCIILLSLYKSSLDENRRDYFCFMSVVNYH